MSFTKVSATVIYRLKLSSISYNRPTHQNYLSLYYKRWYHCQFTDNEFGGQNTWILLNLTDDIKSLQFSMECMSQA